MMGDVGVNQKQQSQPAPKEDIETFNKLEVSGNAGEKTHACNQEDVPEDRRSCLHNGQCNRDALLSYRQFKTVMKNLDQRARVTLSRLFDKDVLIHNLNRIPTTTGRERGLKHTKGILLALSMTMASFAREIEDIYEGGYSTPSPWSTASSDNGHDEDI